MVILLGIQWDGFVRERFDLFLQLLLGFKWCCPDWLASANGQYHLSVGTSANKNPQVSSGSATTRNLQAALITAHRSGVTPSRSGSSAGGQS